MSFKIGTKVKLKEDFFLPNTPREMVIESISHSEVKVFWFGNDGSKQESTFDENFLEEVNMDNEDKFHMDGFFDDGTDNGNGSTMF